MRVHGCWWSTGVHHELHGRPCCCVRSCRCFDQHYSCCGLAPRRDARQGSADAGAPARPMCLALRTLLLQAAPEEECKAEFQPVVQLEEVEVATGEEDEEALFDA